MKILLIFLIVVITTLGLSYLLTKFMFKLLKKYLSNNIFESWSKTKKNIVGASITTLIFCILYFGLVVPQYNFATTTKAERIASLPDDDFLSDPKMIIMHAITIDAPPAEVWKWLVQIGGYRAGWYSYTWAENLFGMGVYNTYEIRPEWQSMEVGQLLPYNVKGDVGVVTDVVKDKYFVHRWDCYDDDSKFGKLFYERTGDTITLRNWEILPDGWGDSGLRCTWVLYVEDLPEGKSRLLSRAKVDWENKNPILGLFLHASFPSMHDIMDLEMLHQIKECAEGNASKYKNTPLPEGGIR